jgi:exo-beta-1,3-glucanase (GH17 family)
VTLRNLLLPSLTRQPGGSHNKAHGKRGSWRQANRLIPGANYPPATTTFTTVTTVTDPAAVVWVDQHGKVIYTEFKSAPLPTDLPDLPIPQDAAAPTTNPPVPASNPPPAPAAASSQDDGQGEAVPAAAPPADANANTNAQTQPEGNSGASTDSTSVGGGYGICYDMMADNGQCRTADQMNQELSFIKSQGFGVARTYDIGCDVGAFAQAAANNGMKVIVGINHINNVAGDIETLSSKIGGNWGAVHTVNVGNEVVNNGGSAAAVVEAIGTARSILQSKGFTGNVVAIDTFNQHIAYPAICAASDYCAANAHAFFDPQTAPDGAGDFVKNAYDSISKIANGKKVVITESGWAKSGAVEGASVPGVTQQQQAISSLKNAFAGMQDALYLFQAYDAKYKAPGSRGVETSFGIFS